MKHLALCCLLTLPASFALAQDAPGRPAPPTFAQQLVMHSEGWLSAHPDLRWRREGLQSLEEGRGAEALARFRRAARHADKPSQAMIAEMLWTGRGLPVDRPLAYAWMDIAAERAYVQFVAKREQYWAALDAAQRQRALEVGRPLYAEYRDAVAKPRLALRLRRAARRMTGSRTGFVGALEVIVPGPGGVGMSVRGDDYYNEQFWKPELYFAWHDSIWKDPPTGHVDVRPMEVVRDEQDTPTGGD